MTDRPILRLPKPRAAVRRTGTPNPMPRPRGGQGGRQIERFQERFDSLEEALTRGQPSVELRADPGGIAPERALVFVTAAPISDFARAARDVGLEVLAEIDLDDEYAFPEDFELEVEDGLNPTLYATMPTLDVFQRLLGLWRAHRRGTGMPFGSAPWQVLFDTLADLRPWGPEDRLTAESRVELENRLPFDDDEEVAIELEIWPTRSADQRGRWRRETKARLVSLGGRVIDEASIVQAGFIYDALLVGIDAGTVREMLEDPGLVAGLATLDGLQFILPQTIAQAVLDTDDEEVGDNLDEEFDPEAPFRALLLDGTPLAAHTALNGGVAIEDVHDLVRLSQVQDRVHATSMASLILRGDLETDASPLTDSRLLSIPLLIDGANQTSSPGDRLFVDLVHMALMQAFRGDDPVAPDVFVVNLSIGVHGAHFAGRVTALARLLDYWAFEEGILFVVSAGNVPGSLTIPGVTSLALEEMEADDRRTSVADARRESRFNRTLLSPSEAVNALTVGAASVDLAEASHAAPAGMIDLDPVDGVLPALSSAAGLGPLRMIKPDLLAPGGKHELRASAAGQDTRLGIVERTERTGLHVAKARSGVQSRGRTRGTSCATAMTTRYLLQTAETLTEEDGPYQGIELPRQDLALLTRALAVNSAIWPASAMEMYEVEKEIVGGTRWQRAQEEVARFYGHGYIDPTTMSEAPISGATLVGLGTVRKDGGRIFDFPLPPSLSGDAIHRSMRVTLSWFSPVDPSRARYRLAALEALSADADGETEYEADDEWLLGMKSGVPAQRLLQKGSVWSRRLIHKRVTAPDFDDGDAVPIRVQCRDGSGGALDPNQDIRFAIAVTLQVAATATYDVRQEVREQLLVRLRGGAPGGL